MKVYLVTRNLPGEEPEAVFADLDMAKDYAIENHAESGELSWEFHDSDLGCWWSLRDRNCLVSTVAVHELQGVPFTSGED